MPITEDTGTRLSTIALGAVFVLVLGGIFAADRAITRADQACAALDAVQAASALEGFLAVEAEGLSALSGAFGPASAPDSAAFGMLVETLGAHLGGFRRLWVTDSTGLVRAQLGAVGEAGLPGAIFDIDTLRWLAVGATAARARATRLPHVSPAGAIGAGAQGIVLLEPVFVRSRFAGFAGGTLPTSELVARLAARRRPSSVGVVVRAGADTVLARWWAAQTTPSRQASASLRVPGGARWEVTVARATASGRRRIALWVVSLAVLGALAVGVGHERRQAGRIAERSRELERLSSELLHANRAKSEFLANVSHELRTPLNAIVGFVDLLRDGVYGELGPRQVSPVQRIEASANHLRHLVDQILDLAKMAAGRLEVHTEILDLRPFVLDVASEVESLLSEKGLSLSLAVGTTLPRLRTDPTHLRSILVNLIGNAVKYTPRGGVSVRARFVERAAPPSHGAGAPPAARTGPPVTRPWIALQVSDSGIGIAPRDQERIFEEFEQVNAGPRGESMQRGTGLGLPISRRLARLLGGDITVESVPGKGSAFTLWIPVNPADIRTGAPGA